MNSHQSPFKLNATDISLAYVLLRIIVGINYFNHGFTRLGNIPDFADAMVSAMEGAWMPVPLVRLTAFFVSPVELVAGLLLILGLFTRLSLIVLFVLMAILMYGVTIVQNWDVASSQLIYNIVLFILLAGVGYNRLALDNVFFKGKQPADSDIAVPNKPLMSVRQNRWWPQLNRHRKYRSASFWSKGQKIKG